MSSKENIVGKINMILLNTPTDVDDLTKLRYLYMNLGNLFAYDLKVVISEDLIDVYVDYDNIAKEQTCLQIAQIMNVVLENLNENAKSEIFVRKLNNNGPHIAEHTANEIKFTDSVTGIDYDLILDLTLDLYRIQAGLSTTQFGFTTDEDGKQDVISIKECKDMDMKLGIINKREYKDELIDEVCEKLNASNLSSKEKLKKLWTEVGVNFNGTYEAKQYFDYLLRRLLPSTYFKSYNLYYRDVDTDEFSSLFIIEDEEPIYVIVDDKLGMVLSTRENIHNMLKVGWKTSSRTLEEVIGYDPYGSDIGHSK